MAEDRAITTITLRDPTRRNAPLIYLYCRDVRDALEKIRQGPLEVVEIEKDTTP